MKINYTKVILKYFLFLKIFNIELCQNDFETNLKKFIESPKIIKNQLCSFNSINATRINYLTCKCYDGFVKDDNIRKINKYEVDCSYQLKSRLITFVLSLIVPFGIDYLYLGYYSIFIIAFIFAICFIVMNSYLFICILKYDRLTSDGNIDKNFEKKYNRYKCIVIIIDFIALGIYIINASLQGAGVIKDKNGFSTIYDYYIE